MPNNFVYPSSSNITLVLWKHLRKILHSSMDVRIGQWEMLSVKESVLLNCGVKKTPESPLDCMIISVNAEVNQPWILISRTVLKLKLQYFLYPPYAKSWLIGKDPDVGKKKKNWRQKEKGTAEDEIDSITNSLEMNLSKVC